MWIYFLLFRLRCNINWKVTLLDSLEVRVLIWWVTSIFALDLSDSVFSPQIFPLLACHLVLNVPIKHSHLLDDLSDLHLVVKLLLAHLEQLESIGLSDAENPLNAPWTVNPTKELEWLTANLFVYVSIHMDAGRLLHNFVELLAPNGSRLLWCNLV